MVPPDGSKEGWDESNEGDKRRDALFEYMATLKMIDYVEVAFGGDLERDMEVVTRSSQDVFEEEESYPA